MNELVRILTLVTKSSVQLLPRSNLRAHSLLQRITFIYIHYTVKQQETINFSIGTLCGCPCSLSSA